MGHLTILKSSFSRFSGIFFLLVLVALAYAYDFQTIISLEPQSVHAWRQADCASFALNYYMENRNFFDPSINFIGESGTGQTISDFPLIYFIIGNIWKVTGQHEFIFRGFVLTLFLASLFLLYRTLTSIFQDKIWAMLVSAMLFTSPVLVYYSNNFLMNIPAFSFVIIGWHFFEKFYRSSLPKHLWTSMIFFTLAGLLKTSALLSFCAITGAFILESLNLIKFSTKRIFPDIHKNIWPFIFAISSVIAWISYVKYYNSNNNRDFFLVGILPIWEMTSTEIAEKFQAIYKHWIFHNFPGYFQGLIVLCWLTMLILARKTSKFFLYLNLTLAIGAITFLLLFYQVIAGHDYYWIDLYILLLITTLSFVYFLKKNYRTTFKWGKLAFFILLIFNVIYCQKKINERYHGAYMDYYNQYLKDFSSFKQVKSQFGLNRNDLVISIPEGTINASLYLMDQKGWSTYGSNFETEEFFRTRISKGARFLLVSDSTLLRKNYIQPFIHNKLGQFKSISIFALE